MTILQELKLPDGTAKALVEGVQRIRIFEYLATDPYLMVRVEVIEEPERADVEAEALMRNLVSRLRERRRISASRSRRKC